MQIGQVFQGAREWNGQLWGSGGQRSRSREAEVRFGGPAEASFSTTLGRVAFLSSVAYASMFWAKCTRHRHDAERLGGNATAACISISYVLTSQNDAVKLMTVSQTSRRFLQQAAIRWQWAFASQQQQRRRRRRRPTRCWRTWNQRLAIMRPQIKVVVDMNQYRAPALTSLHCCPQQQFVRSFLLLLKRRR